jgi:putative restriction endonuclease
MLDKYIKKFSNLRTDKGKHRYPSITLHRAPHKPFLLMAVMDLIAQGIITENFIEPSLELLETFNSYWYLIMPLDSKTSMAHPFPRLQTDGFWHRVTNPGYDPKHDYNLTSMTKLREIVAGARLDDELFQYLCEPETREQLRAVIINKYFAPEVRPVLVEQGAVNRAAYEYSKLLLAQVKETGQYGEEAEGSEKDQKIRDQGFRKVIVQIYDHRCALCGIRMLTPEGHTIVEAAHIKPWRKSYDDRPTNGLALCRLCHWSFDKGLMSVGKEYEVLVSRRVRMDQNNPGHIFTLEDRQIFKPQKQVYWPSQNRIEWHRKNAFRK